MELLKYDQKAAQIGLRQSREVSNAAYLQRLAGIQRDIESAYNEFLYPDDAYWSGEYQIGVDGRGNAALVTYELGMIPGRVYRENSSAMSDSMVRNVAYTLDQINEGNLPHSSWRAAKEQVRQFRAFQQEAVTLASGESMLGYVMNGLTTEDGVALIHMIRHGNIISYETRLVCGISEGAASDLLGKFISDDAVRVSLKDNTNNTLYATVKGIIDVDLKDKTLINGIVQDVLDKRHETKTQTMMLSACRTTAVVREENIKKVIPIESRYVNKQELVGEIKYKKPFEDLPPAPTYLQSDRQPSQKQIWDTSVKPWLVFNPPIKKEGVVFFETQEKKKQEVAKQVVEQEIYQEEKRVDVEEGVSEQPLVVQTAMLSQKESSSVVEEEKQREELRQGNSLLPITTFVVMSDVQTVPTYEEKVIALLLAAIKPKYREQTIQEDIMVAEYVPISVQQQIVEQDVVFRPEIDLMFGVDQLMIVDMQTVIESIGKQMKRGKSDTVVTKLVWMMPNEQLEFVPVEEVEIAQDSTHTLQNLLHFLRKVVHKYVGDDVIRQRVIQRITSDKWDDEIEEIAKYLTILKTQRMYNHLFAVVN